MLRRMIVLSILWLSFIGFSCADFQSELDKCIDIQETQLPWWWGYTNKYDQCVWKVIKKYTLTKSNACKLKDGLYTNNDYMIKVSWPNRTAESREFYKYNNTIYYVVDTFTNDGQSSDYLYSYWCKSKKTLDVWIYFKNSGEFWRIITIKAIKENRLLLEWHMVPRWRYALFDVKKMEIESIKPNNLQNFSQLKNQVSWLWIKYFQAKNLSLPNNINSREEYVALQLKKLDWSPLIQESSTDVTNLITIHEFDKYWVAKVSFNLWQRAFAASKDLSDINLWIVDFFNKIYAGY
jgi:hypothetical protein